MNKQMLKTLQKAIRENLSTVKFNKTWAHIHDQHDIGRQSSNRSSLYLSFEDRSRLRDLVQSLTGGDILHASLDGDRIDISKDFVDEKLSTSSVFGDLLWATRPSQNPIPLTTGDAITPPGSFVSLSLEQLNLSSIQTIVIVENGAVFRHISDTKFPDVDLDDALFVYRGHNSNQRQVMQLVQAAGTESLVIGFFDYDPEGVIKGLELGIRNFILPYNWHLPHMSDPITQNINNAAKFAAQFDGTMNKYRCGKDPVKGNKILGSVLEGSWSVMQEHMISHSLGLTMVKI